MIGKISGQSSWTKTRRQKFYSELVCNGGIPECRDGSDEDCEDNIKVLVVVIVFLVLLTFCIYFYLKWKIIFEWAEDHSTTNAYLSRELSGNVSCVTYAGDDLANLKVS